jgi:uncharacterized protein (DUF58 family)
MNTEHKNDAPPEVYVSLESLVKAKYETRGFNFLPRHSITSILSGTHASRLRGRGLDFEEVRGYVNGDDIRAIDWKVTARTKKPHTKVYTEEKERPSLILVDQSSSMFFGTKYALKSVIAAQAAALSAWRILSQDDRVGGIVFNDNEMLEVKPKRDRRAVLRFLGQISGMNHQLDVESYRRSNPAMLTNVLKKTASMISHDYLVVIISDFRFANVETLKQMALISRHNDVVTAQVFDPMERELPIDSLVVSDGTRQFALENDDQNIRDEFKKNMTDKTAWLAEQFKKYRIIHLPLSTELPASNQLRMLIGRQMRNR